MSQVPSISREHIAYPGAQSPEISHPKKAAFLEAFRTTGNVSGSARAAGMHRRTHYDWLEADAEYAVEFRDAKEDAIEHLEGVARERAVNGSDVLMIFLLKSLRPEVYRERMMPAGGGLKKLNFDIMTDEQLARIRGGEHPYAVLAATRAIAAPAEDGDGGILQLGQGSGHTVEVS